MLPSCLPELLFCHTTLEHTTLVPVPWSVFFLYLLLGMLSLQSPSPQGVPHLVSLNVTCSERLSLSIPLKYYFFKKFIYFIYLFLATLGLHCCAQAFSSCCERGLLFLAVHGLLIVVAPLVVEHGL